MGSWIISSSVLIIVIILLRYIFKGKISLRVQYGLWLVVAVRLLLPFNIGTSSFSVQNLTEKAMTQPQIKTAIEFSEQMVPITSYESAYKEVVERYEEEGRFVEGVGVEEMEYEAYTLMEEVSIAEIIQKAAFLIWLIGIAVVGATFFISNIIFAKRVKNTRKCLQVPDVNLPVYMSDLVETPCLFGIFKPAIYVTEAVAEDATLLRHSLLHEYTHYAHGDLCWSVIRCICLSMHWYNPLVWKAAVLSKQDAELACDEDTIRKLGEDERTNYGKTLIQLTCERRQNLFVAGTTMASEKKSIKERIILIARKPKIKVYALVLVVAAILVSIGCTFTNGKNEEDNIVTTKEEVVDYEGMYSILVEVADGRNLVVALDMDEIGDEYYQVKQIYIYDGEELLQTIIPEKIPVGDIVLWEGLFVNKGYEVGKADVRDLNFDGAEDFGLLCVSTYPKNVPYSYFLWNEDRNQFDYSFTTYGASALEVDEDARRLIIYSHDTMGEYEDYYGYSEDGKLVLASELEQLHKTAPRDKVCLAIIPDGISTAGGDYYYIIPENQMEWLDAYKEMKSYATSIKKPISGMRSQGIWIVFNKEWTEITEDGFIVDFKFTVKKEQAQQFWERCVEEAMKYGSGMPLRPEEIGEITSAMLAYDGVYTVEGDELLDRLEKSLSNSKELRGGAGCPFTASLSFISEKSGAQQIYLATDSCNVWLSDGVYYQYSDFEDIEELKEAMQKAHELEQQNKDLAPSQYLAEIDWRSMKGRFSEEDMEAIHRNLPALEGGEVTWIYRSAEEENPDTYIHDTKQTTLQGIVDQWCEESDRESEKVVVNSFLFADVFSSGKKDICLLIEHFGWYWMILHQEDGVIYAIDMPVRWFEGVQTDGFYCGSGGAFESYYKRMSFANGDYTEESVADVRYGVLYIDGVEQSDAVYQDWKDKYIKEEVEWHTPIK